MPTIFVNGPKVDDLDKKRRVVKEITDVIENVYGENREDIVVVIREDEPTNAAKAGVLVCDMKR